MSRRYLCVACWRRPTTAEVWYRCPACRETHASGPAWLAARAANRPAAGDGFRPAAGARRSWFHRWLGDDDAGPRCPRHPGAALDLACACGHPLSSRASASAGRPVALGFVGPRGSGKTLYLIAALRALRGLSWGDATLGLLGVDGTEARFAALASPFLHEGRRPRATPPEPEDETAAAADGNLCWELHVDAARAGSARSRRTAPRLLTAFDVAGETWSADRGAAAPRLARYLELVGGLVFLVDGAGVAADLGMAVGDAWDPASPPADGGAADLATMSALIDRLGPRSRQVDLALVVSKSDRLWPEAVAAASPSTALPSVPPSAPLARRPDPSALERLLAASGRQDLATAARGHFRSLGLFACSSLGFWPTVDDVRAERLVRAIEPVGVAEPISWLLERRGVRLGARRERG